MTLGQESLYHQQGKEEVINTWTPPLSLKQERVFFYYPNIWYAPAPFIILLMVSGVQLFTTCGLQPTRLPSPWDFSGKNTGVCCHFLLQRIFPTQGFNLHPLHWQVGSLPGKPIIYFIYYIVI